MSKFALPILFSLLTINHLSAQILTTQIGRMRFYNTLDSAKSAWITTLTGHCYCLLQLTDFTHSIPLKLDMDRDLNPVDTPIYRLDYNLLSGNLIVTTDSTTTSIDSLLETPGIYIKIRDTAIWEDTVLRILDYGIHHYAELKRRQQAGELYDRTFINRIIAKKPSLNLRRIMAYCKK